MMIPRGYVDDSVGKDDRD